MSDRRVTLVPLERRHLLRTREWANDPGVMRLMGRAAPVDEAEHEVWFQTVVSRADCAYFAIELTDGSLHVGNIWLWAIDPRHRKAELRVVIGDPESRHLGLGSEAIDLLCRHAFETLHLHRIYAYVLVINPAGRRAFERAGFSLEGTLTDDRWQGDGFTDTALLARLG